MSRTFSTSPIQRDVIHAHGQMRVEPEVDGRGLGGLNRHFSSRVRRRMSGSAHSRTRMAPTPDTRWDIPTIRGTMDRPAPTSTPPARRRRPGAPVDPEERKSPVPGMNLTRDEAAERAAHLAVQSYDVDPGRHHRPGGLPVARPWCSFASSTPGASTFIDLIARDVLEVELNGRALDAGRPSSPTPGSRWTTCTAENVLRVVADCRYMNTGEGLHRFVDPVDKEVYLYSQFEVADSRRVFAVFEQPDLKAEFTFSGHGAEPLDRGQQPGDPRARAAPRGQGRLALRRRPRASRRTSPRWWPGRTTSSAAS